VIENFASFLSPTTRTVPLKDMRIFPLGRTSPRLRILKLPMLVLRSASPVLEESCSPTCETATPEHRINALLRSALVLENDNFMIFVSMANSPIWIPHVSIFKYMNWCINRICCT